LLQETSQKGEQLAVGSSTLMVEGLYDVVVVCGSGSWFSDWLGSVIYDAWSPQEVQSPRVAKPHPYINHMGPHCSRNLNKDG